MTFDASTFLSVLSLVVAIATALAAHHYFKRNERQRDEDIIQAALAKFTRCRTDAMTLKRERSKTGRPISEEEQRLFEQLDVLASIAEELERELLKILATRMSITPEIRSAALTSAATTESLSMHLQMIAAKFQNFNNNKFSRLVELQEQLPKLESLLRERLRKS